MHQRNTWGEGVVYKLLVKTKSTMRNSEFDSWLGGGNMKKTEHRENLLSYNKRERERK
jgi:hypothetical protein